MKLQVLFGVAVLAGCASHPQPTQNLTSSMAAVRGAEEVGAENVPEAKLYLQLAKDEVANAQRMMNDGKGERADLMSRRAYSDAELSISLTREHAARMRAQQAAQFARSQQSNFADQEQHTRDQAQPGQSGTGTP